MSEMRQAFAEALYNRMLEDDRIWLVTADLGFGLWDKIRDKFPDRFLNTGAAEQAAAGICVGLALEGKIPFFYSITTFLLYRTFETIRTYINHEKIPVKLIGSGVGKSYLHDGISHWADDAPEILKIFKNIKQYWPQEKEDVVPLVLEMIQSDKPSFIGLKK